MSGLQLTVAIFFWGSAVVIGLDALKAEGWRRIVLWSLTASFVLAGFLVRPLWEVFPDVSSALVRLVGSPVTWFGLAVVAYLVLRSPPPLSGSEAASVGVEDVRLLVRDELDRNHVVTPGECRDETPVQPVKVPDFSGLSDGEKQKCKDVLEGLFTLVGTDVRAVWKRMFQDLNSLQPHEFLANNQDYASLIDGATAKLQTYRNDNSYHLGLVVIDMAKDIEEQTRALRPCLSQMVPVLSALGSNVTPEMRPLVQQAIGPMGQALARLDSAIATMCQRIGEKRALLS